MDATGIDEIAANLLALWGTGSAASRYPALDTEGGYSVAARVCALRRARGERTIGRKIGFTNTTIWPSYGISAPMWNFVYDTTVRDLATLNGALPLAGLVEPRIEPEIVLRLGAAPSAGMDDAALLACVERVAHGFEIVQSVYPGWKFTGPESAAAFGLHGALLVGRWHAIADERDRWADKLADFSVILERAGRPVEQGHARNVLGGPLKALRFLVDEIDRFGGEPLEAGEIVTTGTLTDAHPVVPGDLWSTRLTGLPIDGIQAGFA